MFYIIKTNLFLKLVRPIVRMSEDRRKEFKRYAIPYKVPDKEVLYLINEGISFSVSI